MKKYTVLMSVYIKDNPKWLEESINSMLNQTIKPDEILILIDGPIKNEVQLLLEKYQKENKNINLIFFKENRGLGSTLREGVKIARNELIARMDSDDISIPNRCELQLEIFDKYKDVDVVGGNIIEFIDNTENIVSYRKVPQRNQEIKKFAKKRNPFNHPSVMFKKSAVLNAGNYQDFHLCEDYDLWGRMIINNSKFYNIQENLVFMRTTEDFYKRRGGLKYLKSMLELKRKFYSIGFYNLKDLAITSFAHIIACLVPNSIRNLIYKKILRSK